MISLNAIVSRIESFAANHYFIKTFSFGKSADSLDIEKLGTYPALYLVYNGADYGEGTKTYNFELYLIDLPGREEEIEEQRKEAVSDSEQCLEDILADIESGGNIFLFDEDYNVENGSVLPVYATHSNVLAGALLDISISVPYDRSACNLPLDGVQPEGGEFTYARRGLLRMLTINGATDVLSVNTIRVPNGTLTDNGNGDVTLSISGAGGGVSSVNEVEPDVNGNIALDTDDIPEGASNLYYTDARADARIAAASVTDLSDVTSAGSGAIITTSERTQIGTNTSDIAANAGAISTLDGEAIKSVNSLLPTAGNLALDTDDIGEGGTNLYYTDARVDARVAALDLATESYVNTQVGNEESARISADSVLQGQINTLAGSVSTNSTDISDLENGVGNVTSVNSLTGDVTLSAGSNVTLTQVGNDIEISSSGGGGGGGGHSFGIIDVPGQSSIIADSGNDTLNINEGTGIQLTTNAGTDTLTIGIDATTTDIPEGTNLYYTEARVSANTDVAANTAKLAGIEAGAEVNPTSSEIKTAYESNANTNAYTDAEKSKLSGIAAGAEVNVNADWSATSGDAQILNKPTLAAVATSGAYADLSGTPTIPTSLSDLSGDTDDITEGSTNLYFTNTRADARISAASILDLNDTPSTYGTNGQVLTTDGSGSTSWVTPSGGGGGNPYPKHHALWQGSVSGTSTPQSVVSWVGFPTWAQVSGFVVVTWDSSSAVNAAKEYIVPQTGLYEANCFFAYRANGNAAVKFINAFAINGSPVQYMARTTKNLIGTEYDGVGGTGVLRLSAGDRVTFLPYVSVLSGPTPSIVYSSAYMHFAIRMIDG